MSSRRSTSFWVAALLLAVILVPTTLASSKGQRTWSTRNASNDRRAPKPVDILKVSAADKTSVTLDWPNTTDNVGVAGYGVYLDGTRKANTALSNYTLTGLVCGKGFTAAVDAFDAAGNRSRKTSSYVSTAACGDVTPPSTPTGVQTVATTETEAILAWSPSTDDVGVVGYDLYVGGFWVGQWTQPSATITNLSCRQTYQIGIAAIDAAGNRSAQASAFFTTAQCVDRTAPSTPTALAVGNSSQTGVTLTWAASTDNSGSIAEYGLYRDGAKVDIASATTGSFTGLVCGRTYTFGVDAADAAQNRSAVASLSAATAPCAAPPPPTDTSPTAPPNLHTTTVTQTSDALAWDPSTAVNGMAGYQIFRDGAKIGEGPGVHGGFTNTWNDPGRLCGTKYHYGVAGVDSTGKVGPQAALDVTTTACDPIAPPPPVDTTAPTGPTGVTASTRTATSIALTWTPSTDNVGVTGYGMYRAGSRVGNATSSTWIYSGLTCGTSYTLGVDAVDAAGNRSSQAVVMVSTTACSDTQAPTAPAGLNASNVTQTGAALAWNPSTDNVGVTGYDVYRNGAKVATVTSPSSSQSGLTCGTSYTYGVVAYDAAGNRSTQTQLVSSTAACSAPPPPPPSGGTISSSECNTRAAVAGAVLDGVTVTGGCTINAANVTIRNATLSGMVDIRPNATGSKLLNSQSTGFGLKGADNVLIEGNVFDGQGKVDNNEIYDEPSGNTPDGFVIRNNTFKNFYVNDGSTHSEAMFIGYSKNGLIEGNTFTNNGNTGHIFFTWWGGVANPSTSYPRDMCVRNNTFNATWDAYYDVNFRAEIPTSANIKIQSSASSTSPQFYASC